MHCVPWAGPEPVWRFAEVSRTRTQGHPPTGRDGGSEAADRRDKHQLEVPILMLRRLAGPGTTAVNILESRKTLGNPPTTDCDRAPRSSRSRRKPGKTARKAPPKMFTAVVRRPAPSSGRRRGQETRAEQWRGPETRAERCIPRGRGNGSGFRDPVRPA